MVVTPDAPKRLSQRQYAQHRKALGLRGGSLAAVQKALQDGRIQKDAGGLIDAAEADLQWEARTAHKGGRGRDNLPDHQGDNLDGGHPPEDPTTSGAEVRVELEGQPHGGALRRARKEGPDVLAFDEARAAKETWLARLRQLEFEMKSGKLLDSDEVQREWYKTLRLFRDRMIGIPDRIADQLAAEGNAAVVHALLLREVRSALTVVADEITPPAGDLP